MNREDYRAARQAERALASTPPAVRELINGVVAGTVATAVQRHIVLVTAALAICAVTAAWLRDRTDAQAPPPVTPVRPRRPTRG